MSSQSVIEAARTLQPLISEHRRADELHARLTPEVVAAAGKAGLFRLFAPREAGGLEVAPPDAFRATAEVAAADPAVSWYMVNSIPASMTAAIIPEPERRQLFAEPDRNFGFSAVALAARVVADDGPRLVNGRPGVRLFLVRTDRLDNRPDLAAGRCHARYRQQPGQHA
jgi:hypothetical protein